MAIGVIKKLFGGKNKVGLSANDDLNKVRITDESFLLRINVRGSEKDRINSDAFYKSEVLMELKQHPQTGVIFIEDIAYDRMNFTGSEHAIMDLRFRCELLRGLELEYTTEYLRVDPEFSLRSVHPSRDTENTESLVDLIRQQLNDIILNPGDSKEPYTKKFELEKYDSKMQDLDIIGGVFEENIEGEKYFSTGEGFGTNVKYSYKLYCRNNGEPLTHTDLSFQMDKMPYCGEDHEDIVKDLMRFINSKHSF